MFLISTIYKTFLDALFPISEAEREIFVLQPEDALGKLPRAPGYEGLAIPKDEAEKMSSIFAYKDERVAKLIWNVKYKRSVHAVRIGGYVLLKWLQRSGVESRIWVDTLVIPMPITNRRRKERGYNQCELLVDEIGRLDKENRFKVEKKLLIRTHHASRQTLKSREDRLESAKGIFGVDEKRIEQLRIELFRNSVATKIEKIPVVIIDDVITTGSTMFEAIETLKKAGFEDVRGLSLAH